MTKTVAGGTLPLFLTAWKGAREGIHYPIGDVYFDLANYAQEHPVQIYAQNALMALLQVIQME